MQKNTIMRYCRLIRRTMKGCVTVTVSRVRVPSFESYHPILVIRIASLIRIWESESSFRPAIWRIRMRWGSFPVVGQDKTYQLTWWSGCVGMVNKSCWDVHVGYSLTNWQYSGGRWNSSISTYNTNTPDKHKVTHWHIYTHTTTHLPIQYEIVVITPAPMFALWT